MLGITDWSHVYRQQDASAAYDFFENTIVRCINSCKKEIIFKSKYKKLKPLINNNICRRIEKRNKLYKQVKNKPQKNTFRNYYIHYRNSLKKDIELAKLQYYQHIFEKSKGNTKETWRTINDLSGQSKQDQSFCLNINDELVKDPQSIANEFNRYF
jgi:hypothetical protein